MQMASDEDESAFIAMNEKSPILENVKQEQQYPSSSLTRFMYFAATLGAFCGFIFGYDTGVISGAMIPLKKEFELSLLLQVVVVSVTIGGAILGSLTSALLNEKCGRKIVLLIASGLFAVGAIFMASANGTVLLILGRLIVGLAIGYSSMTGPVYVAEITPREIRGKFGVLYQLFITFGIFLASLMNGMFSYIEHEKWRYMLGIAVIPSIFMLIGYSFVPESPRWLLNKGRSQEATNVLKKLRGVDDVNSEVKAIQESINAATSVDEKQTFLKMLQTPSTRKALLVGCSLQLFQQLSAINTVMYYSGTIIEMSGVSNDVTIIWLASLVSFVNVIFTLIAFVVVERFGRRLLTLSSYFGVFSALCLLAITFYVVQIKTPAVTLKAPSEYVGSCSKYDYCFSCVQDSQCGFCYVPLGENSYANGSCLFIKSNKKISSKVDISPYCNLSSYKTHSLNWTDKVCPTNFVWLPILAMMFYLVMFAPGLGPMPWTINAEIYPLWCRSVGTSVSTATNWISNLIISLTFLNIVQGLSLYGAFLLYSAFTFIGFICIFIYLPETKGKTLEEIEKLFK